MIFKHLKDYNWVFDETDKKLILYRGDIAFDMDKVRMLSLMRFMIRVMARMSTPRRKHDIQK